MGNRVSIYPTKFVDMEIDGREVDVTYGLRVADDNDSTYTNSLTREEVVGRSPGELVALARGIDDRARDMIDFAEEEHDGIDVGSVGYTWDEIGQARKPG